MVKKSDSDVSAEGSHSDSTKRSLIDAATRVFARVGFDGATVKDISEAAGVNVSLVSYHFGGKEGLYKACLEEFGSYRLNVSKRILQTPQSAEEFKIRLEMFVSEMIETFVQQPDVCMMIQRECEMGLPVAEDVFRQTFLQVFNTIVTFLKDSIDHKIIKRGLDPLLSASCLMGSILHLNRNNEISEKVFQRSMKDPKHKEKAIQQIVLIFCDGILEKNEKL